MDLLKRSSLNEEYHLPGMEGLASLFRGPLGVQESYVQYAEVYNMMIVCVWCAE